LTLLRKNVSNRLDADDIERQSYGEIFLQKKREPPFVPIVVCVLFSEKKEFFFGMNLIRE